MTKEDFDAEVYEYAKSRNGTEDSRMTDRMLAYRAGAEPREKRIQELEAENERITTKYYELQETLKKVRLALIKERTANIMNYGKGGVEMFDSMFEILKGVSN